MDKVLRLIKQEEKRQQTTLMMIPSENYTYPEVRQVVGSILMHKYSEGQPGKRYYQGNVYIDEIENIAKERAMDLFKLNAKEWSVNVQALSGSPANVAIYNALLEPGDTILSLYLPDGGHLSHGWHTPTKKLTLVSKMYNVEFYHIDPKTQKLNYKAIEEQALKFKPKMIVSGGTGYPSEIDHKALGAIAKRINAYYLADVSHEAGLIAGGANKSPFSYSDVVMMTTHKTLRGPRGALIFSRLELASKIDSSILPGMQGGPHNHTIAGIAIALEKAKSLQFRKYALQTVLNARVLAKELKKNKIMLVSGDTEKHLLMIDLRARKVNSWFVAESLEAAGIIVNRNTIFADADNPKAIMYPSGVRLGTPAITARGMKERQMKQIATWIVKIINQIGEREIPDDKVMREKMLKSYKKEIQKDAMLKAIRKDVEKLCKKFPIDLT
jgi:glycine hydroxymethyltransferase